MRVIDPENGNPFFNPEKKNTAKFKPEILPVRSLEIDRQNVLIPLWRIFGKLYRSVRTPLEPLGVLLHIGMIRRALKCNIDSDSNTLLLRLGNESTKFSYGTKLRMHGFMTTFSAPDCPAAPRFIRPCRQSIVLPLSLGQSYRMNRRKIDDVEPHSGNKRNQAQTVPKGAVHTWLASP